MTKRIVFFCFLLIAAFGWTVPLRAQIDPNAGYHNCIIEGAVPNNGITDAQPGLQAWFAKLGSWASDAHPITGVIPAGNYYIGLASPANTIVCPSNVTIIAYGANFVYPASLTALSGSSAYPMFTAFSGTDVSNFTWKGGNFIGNVFNQFLPAYTSNLWQPKEGVISFDFESSTLGCINDQWQDVHGINTGGSVVMVNGVNSVAGGTYATTTVPAQRIRLINCNFRNCGAFLWDYGWLWQLLSFQVAGGYTANQVAMATQYLGQWANTLYGAVGMANGSANITFNNSGTGGGLAIIPIAPTNAQQYCVSFYAPAGGSLPANITQGLQYYVVGSNSTSIQVSATFGGSAITFSSGGTNVQMIHNITNAFYNAFAPFGFTTATNGGILGDGAWWITNAQNVLIQGCTYSSPGDSGFMGACQDSNLVDNQEIDAEMGMLWFNGCLRCSAIGGNYSASPTYGGSRTLTVENICVDTIVDGATFNGGRRGCVLDSPNGLKIVHCKFNNNTWGDVVNNYTIGRIYPTTGTWATFSFNTLTSTLTTAWDNVTWIDNDIVSNSTLNICDIEYNGTGLIWDQNVTSGTHQSIKNEGNTVSGIYVGRGIGMKGYDSGITTQAIAGTTFTFGNTCGTSVQSTNGIDYLVTMMPLNAASPAITYASGTNSVYTVTVPSTTATVSYAWTIQENMH